MRPILAALAVLATMPAAHSELGRDTLGTVVRSCVLAKRTLGLAFPCRQVELGRDGAPGYAILQVPLSASHFVVMPAAPLSGMESPELRRPEAAIYWQAALAARPLAAAALDGRVPVSGIGMAVNSQAGRTQDHLHIHVDCVHPRVLAALGAHRDAIRSTWARLDFPLEGERYVAKRVDLSGPEMLNPFADMAHLPGAHDQGAVSLAVIGAPDPVRDGASFLIFASTRPGSHAETLLDHSCAIANTGRLRR